MNDLEQAKLSPGKPRQTLAEVFSGYMREMRGNNKFSGIDQYLMMKVMAACEPISFKEINDYQIVASFRDGSSVTYEKPVALIMASRRR